MPTLFTQEMLKKGFLANNTAIPTYAHKPHHVAVYLQAVREVFADIARWLEEAGGKEASLVQAPGSYGGRASDPAAVGALMA